MAKLPLQPDGSHDKEAVRAAFMASPYLDWTRFAEEQGWHPTMSRQKFPVATWQKEKRDDLTARHMDILAGMFHERKFNWTKDVLKTLEDYPTFIDRGKQLVDAKMSQLGDMAKDYFENFRGKEDKMFRIAKNKTKIRVYHPWEKNGMEVSLTMSAAKSIQEAKHKSLMLDKWAMPKFDMPLDAIPGNEGEEGVESHRITVAGNKEITVEQLQGWWDKWHDKPVEVVLETDEKKDPDASGS